MTSSVRQGSVITGSGAHRMRSWGDILGDGVPSRPPAAEQGDTRWRQLADAQRAIIDAPRRFEAIHHTVARHALTVTGATTVAVSHDGSCVAHAGHDTGQHAGQDAAQDSGHETAEETARELAELAASGHGEHPWRGGSAIVAARVEGTPRQPWSVVLVVGSETAPFPEGVAELCDGLLAVAEAQLASTATFAAVDKYRRQLEAAQRLARVGSWEWTATPENPGSIFDGAGVQTWSPMLYELFEITPNSVDPSALAFMAAVHPDDQSVPGQALKASKAGGVRYFEYRVPLADGSLRWLQGTAETEFDAAGDMVRAWGTALDITERRQSEGELRTAEAQFRLALDYAPVGVLLVGLDGRAIRVNRPLAALLGWDPADFVGEAVGAFVHPEDMDCAFGAAIDLIKGARSGAECELRLERADGSYIWTHSSASMLVNLDGKPQHVIVHVQDNTERRAHEADLLRQAKTDALTGLMNRRGWERALVSHLEVAVTAGESMSVGLLDLDHFKIFNDTFGHPAGDRLLTEAAQAWTARLQQLTADRGPASLARIGGEEFGIVLPGCSADEARQIIEDLCSRTPHGQTTSGGVTEWSPGEEMSDTLARADGALYTAKRNGRRRVVAVLPA